MNETSEIASARLRRAPAGDRPTTNTTTTSHDFNSTTRRSTLNSPSRDANAEARKAVQPMGSTSQRGQKIDAFTRALTDVLGLVLDELHSVKNTSDAPRRPSPPPAHEHEEGLGRVRRRGVPLCLAEFGAERIAVGPRTPPNAPFESHTTSFKAPNECAMNLPVDARFRGKKHRRIREDGRHEATRVVARRLCVDARPDGRACTRSCRRNMIRGSRKYLQSWRSPS